MKKLGSAGVIIMIWLLLAGCSGGVDQKDSGGPPSLLDTPAHEAVEGTSPVPSPAEGAPSPSASLSPEEKESSELQPSQSPAPSHDTPSTTEPKPAETPAATASPTGSPTERPIASPTERPIASPTERPIASPTERPIPSPTPSPSKKPEPEPQTTLEDKISLTIVGNAEWGTILDQIEVTFKKGDKPVDVLIRAAKANRLSYEIRGSGAMTYIEGIDGLYEFDDGPLSGWKFKVNGQIESAGAGTYKLEPGDRLEWFFGLEDYAAGKDGESGS